MKMSKAVILSGSPFSVRDENCPIPNLEDIKGKIPLLEVCLWKPISSKSCGGEVVPFKD